MRNIATRKKRKSTTIGFSLIEMMMALAVLLLVVGATFERINKAQANYRVERQKIDFTDQQRTFIDQFTRDLHQAGYPTVYSAGPGAGANQVASQVVTVSSTNVTMEGDLDGSGVQVVSYDYNAATGNLERTVSPKGGAAGTTMVIVQNVLAPTTATPIFSAYDAAGNSPPVTAMKGVGVTLTLQGGPDVNGKTQIQTTMTAMARLPNL